MTLPDVTNMAISKCLYYIFICPSNSVGGEGDRQNLGVISNVS